MPQVLPMTRVEAYLAYKAGVIQESELKPTLKTNFYTGLEHWLAFWCGLCDDYPVDENNDPKWYNEEEYYIAYLCGIAQDYPTNCFRRVGAYLRHIISYRWPEPEKPLTREEYYLSLIKSTTTSNPTPSSNFTLNDTTDGTFQGVEVYGDTFQQTYSGKNLINLGASASSVSGTIYSFSNNVLTISKSSAPASNRYAGWNINNPQAGSSYTFSMESFTNPALSSTDRAVMIRSYNGSIATELATLGKGTLTQTVTLPNDSIQIQVFFYVASGDVESTSVIVKPQIELGSTPSSYEPYTGSTPSQLVPSPNPDYPQDINVVTGEHTTTVIGKNLFNEDGEFVQGFITDLGDLNVNGTTVTADFYTPIRPNTTYATSSVILEVGTTIRQVAFYDKDKNFLSRIVGLVGGKFTTPNEAYYCRLGFRNQNGLDVNDFPTSFLKNIQLEIGSTASDYQPYQSQSYSLSLGSLEICKIGDYQDVIFKNTPNSPLYDNTLVEGGWYKHAEIGKTAFDGSENWIDSASTFAYSLAKTDEKFLGLELPTYSGAIHKVISNRFYMVSGSAAATKPGAAWVGSTNVNLNYNNSSSDLAGFKTWLSDNSMYLYARLITPTNTQITDAALVAQLEALAAGQSYDPLTNFIVTATDPNLPALLKITAYKKQ